MKNKTSSKLLWLTSTVGAILGYGLLHPYAMYIYRVFKEHGSMMVMGLPFALMGALTGFLLGLWLLSRKRRKEAEELVKRLERQQDYNPND